MLVDAGHEVTLFTRGKTPIAERIPDDTDDSFARFSSQVPAGSVARNIHLMPICRDKIASGMHNACDLTVHFPVPGS